jgi:hypothetical protein
MMRIFFCIVLTIVCFIVKSQTTDLPDISSDRPGMATPPSIAFAKKLQLETAASYEKNNINNSFIDIISYNSSLLRYGINKISEVRLQGDYINLDDNGSKTSGFTSLTVGSKIHISDNFGYFPQTSLLLNITLPYFGNFHPKHLAPSMYLLMQEGITRKISICYNIGFEFDGENSVPSVFNAISLGFSLSSKLSAFIENYEWFSSKISSDIFMDCGFAYLLKKNLQLDISGGGVISGNNKYYYTSLGLSWRI